MRKKRDKKKFKSGKNSNFPLKSQRLSFGFDGDEINISKKKIPLPGNAHIDYKVLRKNIVGHAHTFLKTL